ncbi:MAG: CRTAC1 family protein [Bryobacteraceae bacterium]
MRRCALAAVVITALVAAGCGGTADTGSSDAAGPLFLEVAEASGLVFHHVNGTTGNYYLPEIMGSGAALLDYDRDGDLDVYLIQSGSLDANQSTGNKLFRNEMIPSGQLRFTDVTDAAGVGHQGYGMGVAVGDFNNDSYSDLYVTNFGPNVLYRNNKDGTFSDVTRASGAQDTRWSTSAAFTDYDRDGDLDLFAANYVDFTVKTNKTCYGPGGEPDYCTPKAYRPVVDRLFRNDGNGRFTDVTQAAGIGSAVGPGLGVAAADFERDGWPDIYVANDGEANHLWINQHDGTFRETALETGTAYSEDGQPQAGMGLAIADLEADGNQDILVTNLTREGATLYRNTGKGYFIDASISSGLRAPTFAFTGFGTALFDYDNDGRLDLFIANGAVTVIEALRGQPFPFQQRNQFFRGIEGGQFVEVRDPKEMGDALGLVEVSRGAAFGDIDGDGDIDIVAANNNGHARLLLNNQASRSHWLRVQLNGQAIGARVGLMQDGKPTVWRHIHTDGSYLSASEAVAHFGLGDASGVDAVLVQWPDGTQESWGVKKTDATLALSQGSGRPVN